MVGESAAENELSNETNVKFNCHSALVQCTRLFVVPLPVGMIQWITSCTEPEHMKLVPVESVAR